MESSSPTLTLSSDLEHLLILRHSNKVLKDAGFVLDQYTVDELERKRVCDRCGSSYERDEKKVKREQLKRLKRGAADASVKDNEKPSSVVSLGQAIEAVSIYDSKPDNKHHSLEPSRAVPPKKVLQCQYHRGKYQKRQRAWSCCQAKFSGTPCTRSKQHALEKSSLSELVDRYQFHPTPEDPKPSGDYRSLVAVDCEMGTNVFNERELIRVSLVDVTNHEVLLDKLVLPTVDMQHYNTKFSGVTRSMMEDARRTHRCLSGTVQAREEIWKFVRPSTLVIGHDVKNDLGALRWIHPGILDTFIMAKQLDPPQTPIRPQAPAPARMVPASTVVDADEIESPEPLESGDAQMKPQTSPTVRKIEQSESNRPPKGEGKFSLKTLSAKHLQREIQTGKQGHDSVEDALATGDLAIRLAAEMKLREPKAPSGAIQSPEKCS